MPDWLLRVGLVCGGWLALAVGLGFAVARVLGICSRGDGQQGKR